MPGLQLGFRMISAAVAWFAIVLQDYLIITKPGAEFLTVTVRYFSYFTCCRTSWSRLP